jgi:hypothetical protein
MLMVAIMAVLCRAPHIRGTAGSSNVVQILLDVHADVNAQGGWCDNALQAGECRGNGKVAQMLLNANADVNDQGGKYGHALQAYEDGEDAGGGGEGDGEIFDERGDEGAWKKSSLRH